MEFGPPPKELLSLMVCPLTRVRMVDLKLTRNVECTVLAAQKPKGTISKKSKEHEIEMWEAELREALARKRPTVASLSKSDRILVEKQLAKEAESRKAVAEALGRLRRGFALLLCLVHSKTELVREYLATLVKNVLAVIVLRPATLVAPEAFATYQV